MKESDLILIIDMQNVYRPGQPWGCASFDRSLANMDALFRAVEGADTPPALCLTQFVENPDATGMWAEYNRLNRDINADPWMSEIVEELKPWAEKYPVYQKSTYSSMSIPQVRPAAGTHGRVVVTGVVAECCVLATCMECIDLGCHVVYLRDAASGADADSEAAVEKVLAGLSPPHVTILNTAEYLNGET